MSEHSEPDPLVNRLSAPSTMSAEAKAQICGPWVPALAAITTTKHLAASSPQAMSQPSPYSWYPEVRPGRTSVRERAAKPAGFMAEDMNCLMQVFSQLRAPKCEKLVSKSIVSCSDSNLVAPMVTWCPACRLATPTVSKASRGVFSEVGTCMQHSLRTLKPA